MADTTIVLHGVPLSGHTHHGQLAIRLRRHALDRGRRWASNNLPRRRDCPRMKSVTAWPPCA